MLRSLVGSEMCIRDSYSPEQQIDCFMEFLAIRSESTLGPENGSYQECAAFLLKMAGEMQLRHSVHEFVPNKPVIILTWEGTDPSLGSVLLNSHYDVVPAFPEFWETKPFEPHRRANGDIVARGTQDMKSVCVQYLLAVQRLIHAGVKPTRTVHLSFVPDEELGGQDGMCLFVQSDAWKKLNVAVVLDEGLANPTDKCTVFHGERSPWWIIVEARGNTGHGSRFVKDTAMEKLVAVANKALQFRDEQEAALGHDGGCKHSIAKKLGDVTTLNLTMLRAGVSLSLIHI
eukprot:TRINITY_DN18775_c0_g1_i1.p1 TRINITY_DN18775_c0_g1~~TRINITY_DN18775_c0_g1_i1.p1  ORF type:complete len:287 (-),score=82.43 TRINITY_DN18775_c0_g1_i1:167-1027(-)